MITFPGPLEVRHGLVTCYGLCEKGCVSSAHGRDGMSLSMPAPSPASVVVGFLLT